MGPDSGECYIDGKVPCKDRINYVKNIGGVFGQRLQLCWDVPVIDSFSLLKDIYLIFYKDDLKFTYTQSIINNLIYLTPNNPKAIMKDGKIVLKGHKFTKIIKEDIISEKNRITEILECSI